MDSLTISNEAVAFTLAKTSEVQIIDSKMEGGFVEPGNDEGMYTEDGMFAGTGTEIKDPLLSSWPFVIGISVAVLFVSVALGAFLAKRKIKKGIELYED